MNRNLAKLFGTRAQALGILILALAACGGSAPTTPPNNDLPPLSNDAPGLTPVPVITAIVPDAPAPDMTVAVPTISATADGRWDNAATWGGRVPANNDIVNIPKGRLVILGNATANLNGLWVDGALEFADADVAITSKFIMVYGRFQAGTENQPFTKRATITLTGTDATQDVLGMGTKVIGVGAGGLLRLHGERRLAWSQLEANAGIGATSLTLAHEAATWRAGDKIVLASSSFNPREAEVVTVSSVTGKTINFTPALKNAHTSLVQTFEGKKLDQRAAVGLLTRNIVLRGDEASSTDAFGGHVMVMNNGNAQISGVQFQRMGQRGRKGRYNMHWHLGGDRDSNYLLNSSSTESFQRFVVLHSTNNVTVEGNVAYDVPNHAYVWAEDGDERGNKMIRNLGVLVRTTAQEHFAFPINNAFHENSEQAEGRVGVFWGRSLDRHVLRGNIAAGSLDGSGFFIDLFSPAVKGGIDGQNFVFEGNTAHSVTTTYGLGNAINYPEATRGHGLMVTTGTVGATKHVFRNYTGYHNNSGAWLEDRSSRLENSILADNAAAGVMLLRSVVSDIVVVGQSANPVQGALYTPSANYWNAKGAGIDVAGSNHGPLRSPIIESATIINHPGVGFMWDQNYITPESKISNLKFINTPQPIWFHPTDRTFFFYNYPTFGLSDTNGTLTGDGQASRIVSIDSNVIDAQCREFTDKQFFACPLNQNFLLKAPEEIALVDQAGRVTNLRYFKYEDPQLDQSYAQSFVNNGRQYQVMTEARSNIEFQLQDGAGQTIELSFAASGTASKVTMGGQNASSAASLNAMRSNNTSSYFFDVGDQKLFVRLVASSASQKAVIEAPIQAYAPGREPTALPSGAVDGFAYSVYSNAAKYKLQYPVPSGTPARSGTINDTRLDVRSQSPAMQHGKGETAAMRGYVYAPTDGVYRIGVWGNGGGTSLWMGDTWINGEAWANFNSNFINSDGVIRPEFQVFQPNALVALKAGWHPFSVVHAKMSESGSDSAALLIWTVPGQSDTWVYPQVKRAP